MNRETLEREIKASKAAIKAHGEGIEIHQVVLAAFEKELVKCPMQTTPKEEEKNTK